MKKFLLLIILALSMVSVNAQNTEWSINFKGDYREIKREGANALIVDKVPSRVSHESNGDYHIIKLKDDGVTRRFAITNLITRRGPEEVMKSMKEYRYMAREIYGNTLVGSPVLIRHQIFTYRKDKWVFEYSNEFGDYKVTYIDKLTKQEQLKSKQNYEKDYFSIKHLPHWFNNDHFL